MGEKEMTFIRCDRCKKEIPYDGVSYTLKINGEGESRTIDLCSSCLKGLNLYLQRKVNNYADLTKDYE